MREPLRIPEPQERTWLLWAVAAAAVTFILCVMSIGVHYDSIRQTNRLAENDFVNVWAAGRMANEGRAAQAYDWDLHKVEETKALGGELKHYYGWHYPPIFLFIASMLAFLPYGVALAGWSLSTLAGYTAMMRQLTGHPIGFLLALGLPPVIWSFSSGQNGYFTAMLLAGTVYFLRDRPLVSGIFLGMLAYKPQYGLLFPFVLVAEARWKVIAAAAVTVAVLVAATLVVYGAESWTAFVHWLPYTNHAVFEEGRANLNKIQSLLGLTRVLGAPLAMAQAAHWALAALVVAGVVWGRRQVQDEDLQDAMLILGVLMATPYIYAYDMVALAVPLVLLLKIAARRGGLRWSECGLLALAYVCSMAIPFVLFPWGFGAMLATAAWIVLATIWVIRTAQQTAP